MSIQGIFYRARRLLHAGKVRELKVTTIRLDDELVKKVESVASVGGVTASDVVRMCVKHGLPIVEHGFKEMAAMLQLKVSAGRLKTAKREQSILLKRYKAGDELTPAEFGKIGALAKRWKKQGIV